MNKQFVNLCDLYPVIDEVISSGGEFRMYPRGVSMLPLLVQGEDSVVLVSLGDVCVNDMILYRRDNGQFVLHRLVKIEGDEYVMCGDNQGELERGIKREHLLAKVKYFYKKDKKVTLDDKSYQKHLKGLPARRRWLRLRGLLARVKNKIFKK